MAGWISDKGVGRVTATMVATLIASECAAALAASRIVHLSSIWSTSVLCTCTWLLHTYVYIWAQTECVAVLIAMLFCCVEIADLVW